MENLIKEIESRIKTSGLPVNSEVKAKLTVADTCFQTIKKNFYILSI